jgi:hypothetical protein
MEKSAIVGESPVNQFWLSRRLLSTDKTFWRIFLFSSGIIGLLVVIIGCCLRDRKIFS